MDCICYGCGRVRVGLLWIYHFTSVKLCDPRPRPARAAAEAAASIAHLRDGMGQKYLKVTK